VWVRASSKEQNIQGSSRTPPDDHDTEIQYSDNESGSIDEPSLVSGSTGNDISSQATYEADNFSTRGTIASNAVHHEPASTRSSGTGGSTIVQGLPLPPLSNADRQRRRQSTILSDQVVRTAVSKPTDALDLLFDAARASAEGNDASVRQTRPDDSQGGNGDDGRVTQATRTKAFVPGMNSNNEFAVLDTPETAIPITPAVSNLSFPADDVLDVWGKSRFVIQGWFTAQEAVTYVDLYV